jgi:hypothetical protein
VAPEVEKSGWYGRPNPNPNVLPQQEETSDRPRLDLERGLRGGADGRALVPGHVGGPIECASGQLDTNGNRNIDNRANKAGGNAHLVDAEARKPGIQVTWAAPWNAPWLEPPVTYEVWIAELGRFASFLNDWSFICVRSFVPSLNRISWPHIQRFGQADHACTPRPCVHSKICLRSMNHCLHSKTMRALQDYACASVRFASTQSLYFKRRFGERDCTKTTKHKQYTQICLGITQDININMLTTATTQTT